MNPPSCIPFPGCARYGSIRRYFLIWSCCGLAATARLSAQIGGPSGGSAPAPGRPNPGITFPSISSHPVNGQAVSQPVLLSGRVVMEDGTAPPEPVTLQLVCGNSQRTIGYSDSKGRFSIDLASRQNGAIYNDASEDERSQGPPPGATTSGGLTPRGVTGSTRAWAGCDLQPALAGYRAERVTLSARYSLENPDVGVVTLRRVGKSQGTTISVSSALAPKGARRAFEKGLAEEKDGHWENEEHAMRKAVDSYPKYASAWYHLGLAQQRRENIAGARDSYAKAIEADDHYVTPYQQLAVLAARENHWDEVIANTGRLLQLNPVDFPEAWLYNALANFNLSKLEPAERAARRGLDADTAHSVPKLDQILGLILAGRQSYSDAAEHFKLYLHRAPGAPDTAQVRRLLTEVEKRADLSPAMRPSARPGQ